MNNKNNLTIELCNESLFDTHEQINSQLYVGFNENLNSMSDELSGKLNIALRCELNETLFNDLFHELCYDLDIVLMETLRNTNL